jgi:hypothetical protein
MKMRKSEQRAFEKFPESSPIRSANVTEEDRLRWAYIQGYEQAEKDKNEEIYNDKTVLPKAEAVKFAFNLFDQFAKELITALGNTAKNKKCAARNIEMNAALGGTWNGEKMMEVRNLDYEGDVFNEIKDRIHKEYTSIMQPIEYNWPIDEIFSKMKMSKNVDVDTLINENKYRGRNDFHKLMVFKGKLADMLEHYACSSFDLGVKYKEMKDKGENVSTFKDVVTNELGKFEKPCREEIEL